MANDPLLRRILFTDECIFKSDGSINRHNEHHYAVDNPHCIKKTHVQGRFSVAVWAGIVGDHVIGPHFIEGRVNAATYSHFLDHELDDLFDELPYALRLNLFFQQDCHPAHTSSLAKAVLHRKFPGRWIGKGGPIEWPARTPDMTSLDFFLRGYVRDQVYQTLPDNVEDLKNRIRVAMGNVSPQMLARVRENFVKRVALCAEQDGGLFEHLLK